MRSLTVALLLALVAPVAVAQPTIVRRGAHVRVDAPGVTASPTEATILSMTPDTIVIGSSDIAPLSVPRAAIRSIEVASGKSHWRGAKKGTLVGAGWGAGFGILFAASQNDTCKAAVLGSPRTCRSATTSERLPIFGIMVVIGAEWGAVIGAIVGSEQWDKVEMPMHRNIGLRDGKPALSWSLSF